MKQLLLVYSRKVTEDTPRLLRLVLDWASKGDGDVQRWKTISKASPACPGSPRQVNPENAKAPACSRSPTGPDQRHIPTDLEDLYRITMDYTGSA